MGFQTPQFTIGTLLDWARSGQLKLPDFQRSFKWDDERIRQLLVTIVRGHPMGVIMLLETGGDQVRFAERPVEGVVTATGKSMYLLLDGQQRVTSLVQSLTGLGVVDTYNDRNKRLRQRYFLHVEKALGTSGEQDEAVVSVPESGTITENFGRDVVLDVSTPENQTVLGLMPITALFNGEATGWLLDYMSAGGPADQERRKGVFKSFNDTVLQQVAGYQIPAIQLDSATTKEAVTTVFEKVNTGGLVLDVFELLTATFAGDPAYYASHGEDFRLIEDWAKTEAVLADHPALEGLQRTDFLQAVTLLTTLERHKADVAADVARPAATSARRDDMMRLRLDDYVRWADDIRDALPWVAKFYHSQHIHFANDLPYRTQTVPLLVLRVLLGERLTPLPVMQRISQWYWCGVLGELYGSTTETRFARDVEQVPAWAIAAVSGADAPEPVTVRDANFFESRLKSLRTRLSAAYKGIYALLMAQGVRDWLGGEVIDHASFNQLQVDIHHIFPKAWCVREGIDANDRESIANKTPLSKKTNIFLRGDAPPTYLARLQDTYRMPQDQLDTLISAHLIDTELLRAADFHAFLRERREALCVVIGQAMGKDVIRDVVTVDGVERGTEDADAYEPEPADLIDSVDDPDTEE